MAKKIGSHWYTDASSRYVKGEFITKTLENGCLFSKGQYPTSLTKADLPEWFVELYLRGRRYVDTKNIKEIVYKPSFTSDNHLYKDDFLYISYDKPITIRETETGWKYYEDYDVLLWGWPIRNFVDSALKFVKDGDIHSKLEEIDQKLKEKIVWYVHMNPDFRECSFEDAKDIRVEVTLLIRDMSALPRPVSIEEQKDELNKFCAGRGYVIKDTKFVKSKEDLERLAADLPKLDMSAPVRPVFLYVRTNVWNDKPEDTFEHEIFRAIPNSKATISEIFLRKDPRQGVSS